MISKAFNYSLMAAAVVAIAAPASAEQLSNANVYVKDVETHPSQGDVRVIEGATARLVTTADGVWASLDTRELTPGNAYTLWFVAINKPQACANMPCKPPDVLKLSDQTQSDVTYGDGLIAAEDGTGRFTGYLPAGPLPQGWFGNGFSNPLGAEIHLVVHDHGPLLPDLAPSMLGSYRGGCTDESLPAAFPATAKADGTPGPNTCRLVQDVIVTQEADEMAETQ